MASPPRPTCWSAVCNRWFSRSGTVRLPRSRSGRMCGHSRHGRSSSTLRLSDCWRRPAGRRLAAGYPTGGQWIEAYLSPLAEAARRTYPLLHTGDRSIAAWATTGLFSAGRDEHTVRHPRDRPSGDAARLEAQAVIDASGTWSQPNPAGADGLPAIGERGAASAGVLSYIPPLPIVRLPAPDSTSSSSAVGIRR